MLTADHVEARRKGAELVLTKLDADARAAAEELAAAYLADAAASVGRTREELEERFEEHEVGARPKLAAGLRKLVTDACVFDDATEVDPVALRAEVFRLAAERRRTSAPIDRLEILRTVGEARGLDAARVDTLLFADLRGEHVLRQAPRLTARALVEAYELGRAQAVLLRAVRVTCDVTHTSPGLLRAFFAKLKFHGLLFSAERLDDGALRIVLDGPFSMFESVTRYGVRFALVLPWLQALGTWSLEAQVRWGKPGAASALTFRLRSSPSACATADEDVHVSAEVQTLLAELARSPGPWRAEVASTFLEHRSLGVVIPDLVLARPGAPRVYVEMLGYWSRDAVWRRVELAREGLRDADGERAHVVFCASARLRVSEAVLEDDADASLYVFKTKPTARALLVHVERLVSASRGDYPAASCTSSSLEPRAASAKRSPVST